MLSFFSDIFHTNCLSTQHTVKLHCHFFTDIPFTVFLQVFYRCYSPVKLICELLKLYEQKD